MSLAAMNGVRNMRRPPAKAKRDANEADVFAELRAHGLSVYPLDTPLDALVGYGWRTYLVEIKSGPKAHLTPAQVKFIAEWRGQHIILRSVADARAFAHKVRAGGSCMTLQGKPVALS